MSAMTVKNRVVPPFLKTELYLNFKTGLDENTGLFDLALALGVIEQNGKTYQFEGQSIGYRKNVEKDAEFWKRVSPALEKKLSEELRYGTVDSADDLEDSDEE